MKPSHQKMKVLAQRRLSDERVQNNSQIQFGEEVKQGIEAAGGVRADEHSDCTMYSGTLNFEQLNFESWKLNIQECNHKCLQIVQWDSSENIEY